MNKLFTILAVALFSLAFNTSLYAQANVFNPNDPDVIFTATNRPAAPTNSNVNKWGHTTRLGWNPFSFGFKSYIYQGMAFRLKFPKTYQHNVADGKKYPVFIFFPGMGEKGEIYDNEYQLLHGGQLHAEKVNDGTFDGFLFYAQSNNGASQEYFGRISNIIDSLTKHVKADIDRVVVSGLSAGGSAALDVLATDAYNKKIAASLPISGASTAMVQHFPKYITVPIWIANGGVDQSPAPYTVDYLITEFRKLGGKIDQAFFPTQGHNVWGDFWNTAGYWPYLSAQHKSNPLVYFQRNEFCPGVTVDAKLGLNPGFNAYEWDKNGVVIPGATSSQLIVNSFGTYRGRFRRTATSNWSEWSPKPVVIAEKQGTVSPPIQINGMFSNVLPSVDGRTTTPLMVPNTFAGYEWRRVSDNALVSSTNTYNAPLGQYKVKVTEQFGCSSIFSDPFAVISSAGTNLPDNITNFTGLALTSSSVQLDWNDNPTPAHNETVFEIYRSTTQGSGFALVNKTAADVLTYEDRGLLSNTTYYYLIRAINLNGAASVSNEVTVKTKNDIVAPTAPSYLRVTGTSRSSISLAWDPSTDDVAVYKYDVYVDGVKSFITSNTAVTVSGLASSQNFSLYVKARDLAGNESPKSNQVSAVSAFMGLNYKHYQGSWSVLPNFNTLTPVSTGNTPNVDISVRTRNDNMGFLWEGFINIPVTGSYTFETISDDGSKLYIGSYSHTATELVNNDGLHAAQSRTGTITLTAGSHPIAMTFFQAGGGYSMQVYWQSTAAGISRQLIPNSAFSDSPLPPNVLPTKPANLTVAAASYKRIDISWDDLSNNESAFEVVRSTSLTGAYLPIGTTSANATSFSDTVGLSPETKYWYKVRAISQYGQSDFISILEGAWGLNSNYNDASGNNRTLTAGSSPTFNTADKKEGTASISFNGSNQFADMPFSTTGRFPSNAYSSRTAGVWIKPATTSISAANKIIFEFGGSDNGLALRFSSSRLQAGIASNNLRATAEVNSVTTNPNWVSGGWNHVAVVYNLNTLQLFINSVEVASTNLGFSSVGSTTNSSRIGATNSSNAFNSSTSSTNLGGLLDDLVIITEPLTSRGIRSLMTQNYGADTTLSLPSVPSAPGISSITATSTSAVSLTISDNSNNETSFEVYRAVGTSTNFKLQETLPASGNATFQFSNSDLFANTIYTYKVRAIGVGGVSAFSSEVFVKTLNNLPVIASVPNSTMRYDGQKTITISSADADGDAMTLAVSGQLPSFAIFNNLGNGSATIHLTPTTVGDQGVYPISLQVTDANGGIGNFNFNITVNSNYTPVITSIGNRNVDEGSVLNISLAATDQDGNGSLVWNISNAPSFVSLTDNGNGSGSLRVAPGYLNSGVYDISLSSSDGAGGNELVTFKLTVTNVDPTEEKVFINLKYTSANAPTPWNNISSTNSNNLLNSNGQTTPIGIEFLGTPWNAGDAGAVTGNDSGVYPDAVMRDYFWFGVYGAPETVNVNLKGLNPTGKYNVTLYGNSAWRGLGNNGTTVYTINGVQKPLYVDNNTQNTVTFSSIVPNASGIITVNMSKGAATPYGLLTSIVLVKPFDDGTAPVLPTNLAAQALSNGTVKLSWNDLAYNEEKYLVYRSQNAAGPYTLLNTGDANANDSTYVDNSVASSTTYYYKIEATNLNGSSGQTNVVSAVTANKAPVLIALNDVTIKTGQNGSINFSSTDDLGDILSASVTGLPSFASFQNNGNGNGSISFAPGANDLGTYRNIVVRVTDNFGSAVADTFQISVTDAVVRSVFINWAVPQGTAEGAPWNNFLSYPYGNAPITNLKDDANVNTNFSVRLQQQWDGNMLNGMTTDGNTGIFSDNVMKSSIYTTSTSARGIQIDGLDPAKRYNVVFFSSHNAGSSATVTFASGAQTILQESRYNDNKSVQLNGLIANSSGTLVVTATKTSGAAFLNLNAMIIEEYNASATVIRPLYLVAESVLDLGKIRLNWADRSTNETGFNIYRSTSLNGPYSLVTTVGPDVTTYTDLSLNANQRYYYKISAASAGGESKFSNTATVVLPSQIVFVNFNVNPAQNGPSPWNNSNTAPTAGATMSNLTNNVQGNSGLELVITKGFSAQGFAGVTGAGIFPSGVMESNYWNDGGQLSQLKFNNLDIKKKYRIGFFGSAIFTGGYSIANYSSNGKSVQLNSLYNNSKIVYLTDLIPVDGELVVDVTTAAGSPYSFTGAVTIESYDDKETELPVMVMTAPRKVVETTSSSAVPAPVVSQPVASAEVLTTSDIRVFPNPFTDKIDVQFFNEKSAVVTLLIYDLSSKLIYKTADVRQAAGQNKLTVNLPSGRAIVPGSYVVSVMVNGKLAKAVKLIKVN